MDCRPLGQIGGVCPTFWQIACARPTDELVEDRLRVRRNISSTDERAVRMSPRKAYFS